MTFSLRKANQKHDPNRHWPKEKKLQVVAQWLALGNLRLVAEVSGVSYGMVRAWRQQPWWNEFENEIRRTEGIVLDNKISKIVNKALAEVEDRLENGEMVLNNKTGELIRKPVQMRDVHKVAADLLGKREEIRKNAAQAGQVQAIPIQEQLKILAQEFARMTQAKPLEVIDVVATEIVTKDVDDIMEDELDAVHEEWEEGLQEADSMAESTGSGGEAGGEQPSPSDDDQGRQG